MRSLVFLLVAICSFTCGNEKHIVKNDDGSIKMVFEPLSENYLQCTKYYSSGIVQMVARYKGDKLDGVRQLFDSTGLLIEVADFREGKADGLVKRFKGDQLLSVYNYTDNVENGPYQEFYPDGSLKEKGDYYQGNAVGLHYYYDTQGNLISIREYKIVKGKSFFNQWWDYGQDSTIKIETSHFLTVEMSGDSVWINLVAPYFEGNANVIIGDFDSEYNQLLETLILPMVDGELVFDKKEYFMSDTLRVVVQDYMGKGDDIKIKNIYVEIVP